MILEAFADYGVPDEIEEAVARMIDLQTQRDWDGALERDLETERVADGPV